MIKGKTEGQIVWREVISRSNEDISYKSKLKIAYIKVSQTSLFNPGEKRKLRSSNWMIMDQIEIEVYR